MSQGIAILLARPITYEQFQQAIRRVIAQELGATSDVDSLQDISTLGISIEKGRAIIWATFDIGPGYHPTDPEDAELLVFPSGDILDPAQAKNVEQHLGGPIQAIVSVSYAADEGSQRLALLLAAALSPLSKLSVDLDLPNVPKEFFSLVEVQAMLATNDPNPIYHAWLKRKAAHP